MSVQLIIGNRQPDFYVDAAERLLLSGAEFIELSMRKESLKHVSKGRVVSQVCQGKLGLKQLEDEFVRKVPDRKFCPDEVEFPEAFAAVKQFEVVKNQLSSARISGDERTILDLEEEFDKARQRYDFFRNRIKDQRHFKNTGQTMDVIIIRLRKGAYS